MSRCNRLFISPLLAALAVFATASPADAAPSMQGQKDKFLRLHAETDFFGWTHIDPDGGGYNTEVIGFGFGRSTAIDTAIQRPVWSLGLGAVFARGRANVGAKFAFVVDGILRTNTDMPVDDTTTTIVGGLFVPYFRWIFLPGYRVRPFIEGHFGLGGATGVTDNDETNFHRVDNTIWPVVGVIAGAHFYPVEFFSIDLGLGFDYWAPHGRFEEDNDGVITDDDWDQTSNVFNLAVQVGMSVWFG